jgi:hypothetical protein
MHSCNLNRFIMTLGLAAGLVACGGSPTQPDTSQPAQAKTVAIDAVAAEALAAFELQRDGARAWSLISAATKRAPDRADLAYLQATLCQHIEGCQPEAYEARLRKLDPGNAAVWMRSLAAAQRRREPAVEGQILDAIGRAERFDVYWNALTAGISGARIANGAHPNASLSETINWLGATIVPPLQPLTLACTRARTSEQQWADRCRRVARVLMNGDTYLVESLGTSLAQQVVPETSEQTKLNERARTSRYRWRTYAEITNSQIERDKFAVELTELMRKLRREQDVHLAVVRWAGRAVTPPADWKDEGY